MTFGLGWKSGPLLSRQGGIGDRDNSSGRSDMIVKLKLEFGILCIGGRGDIF